MTYKENIRAILECYFAGFKEEIIDIACNRILEQEPCEDAISRQAVLDLAKKGVLVSNGNYESVCKAINEIPSVNPQKSTEEATKEFKELLETGYYESTYKPQKSDNKYRKEAKRWKNKWLKSQKSGHWIPIQETIGVDKEGNEMSATVGYMCSECAERYRAKSFYCSHCGARMIESEEV